MSAAAKPGVLDGVLVGDRVVVGPYATAPTWQTYAVTRTTPTQVGAGALRFRRRDGKIVNEAGHGDYLCARPETADERTERETRAAAEASIGRVLRLHGASLDHVPTAQLVAIAAACEVSP